MPRKKKDSDFKLPKLKSKGSSKVLLTGVCLLVLVGGVVALRFLGVPFPYIFSRVKSAPEGVSVTISLLAFCQDNTTEIISTKEFKLSEFQMVSPSGKEVKYLAITATFLSAPPKDETLQQIQLSYQIAIKTNAGALTPLERTVTLPVVANLALHQTQLIPLTFSELGLSRTGDVAFLQADVKVSADMVTDKGRKLYSSTGHVESQLKAEEGGFARLGPWLGESDKPAPARILASLHGSWTKPQWKSVAIVNLVDTATGLKSYMIAEPGSDSTQITNDTPTPGTPIDTVVIIPTGPTTTTTTTSTVTVPTYDPHDKPDEGQIIECFLAGTLIETPSGGKEISQLKVGEKVLSYVNGEVAEGTVAHVFHRRANAYYVVRTESCEVKVTERHPFLTANGWKTVGDLAIGDIVIVLLDGRLCEEPVLSKQLLSENVDVLNLQVAETETYFAGGFAVHNKPPPPPETTGGGLEAEVARYSWIPNALGLGWLFRGDRLLMPIEMFGVTIDLTIILVVIATVMLIAVGLVLRKGKH